MSDHASISDVLEGRARWCVVTGDCLAVLTTIAAGSVGTVVTDPPYGVNLGTHAAASETRPQYLAKNGYASYYHTPDNFDAVVVPAVTMAVAMFSRALVFCAGTQAWSLPRPASVGGVFLPAGCGRSRWGFQCLAHFLLYGDCPNLNRGAKPTAWSSTEAAVPNDHPCPKPIGWMVRCVELASTADALILDPFCGSGTTGVAAIKTGRRFIGIEIDEGYAAIARRRIAEAADTLWTPPAPKPEQLGVFA